jgi:molybdate transport system substrate-binding protein
MARWRQTGGLGLVAVVASAWLAGCVGVPPSDVEPSRTTGNLVISAPDSLAETLTAVGDRFAQDNPGVAIRIQTTGSATSPIGAADVTVVEDPGATAPFATTQLVIATAADNPKRLGRLADLTKRGLRVQLCAATTACGTATDAMLAEAKVAVPGASRAPGSVEALNQVRDGAVDAAIVYRSDAGTFGDDIGVVELGEATAHRIGFTATVTATAQLPGAAADFVAFLSSAAAQEELAAHGLQLAR